MKDTLKILFNEDVKTDAELIWRELEKYKIIFEKHLVDNKKDFTAGLKSFAPDLIISDYSLPQFNGMQALLIRNEVSPLTPFILVTGSNNETVAVDCMKAGADDYILKDNLSRLGPSVTNAINKADLLKQKKIADDALVISEERYRSIIEKSPDGIAIHQNGKFVFANPAGAKLIGAKDPRELIGRSILDIVHQDSRKKVIERLQQERKGKDVPLMEEKFVKLDGSVIDVEVIGIPISYMGAPAGQVMVRDITERKLAEESVKNSEEKYRSIFENVQDVYYETSLDGTIINLSPSISAISKGQYNMSDLIGRSMFDFYNDPDERQLIIAALKEKGSVPDYEIELKNRDGSVVSCSVSAKIIFDADGNPKKIVGSMRDVSSRKQAEEALERSKKEFQNYFESGSVGLSVTLPDKRWIEVNQKLCQMLGYSKEELLGTTFIELSHPDDRAKNIELFQKSIEGELNNYELEKRFVCKNGKIIYVALSVVCERNPDGTVHHFLASYIDITERVLAEEKIEHERILLRTLIDNLPDPIYVLDKECRKVISNKADVANIGAGSEEEVLGKTDIELFPGDTGIRGHTDNMQVISSGEAIYGREEDFVDKDGNRTWLLTTMAPLKNKYGSITGLVGIGHDITKRKQVEAELISAKQKAEESDKLKTAFLHNISHEIRTPMNAIVGFSALLSEPNIDEAMRQSYIEMIMQGSNHLLSIISDIVDISNIEANLIKIAKNEISLNASFKSLYTQFLPKADEKKIMFFSKNGLSDSDALITADNTKLNQILSNLLSNAFKFTYKGSIEMEYRLMGSFLQFSVTDTGIGIPEEYHKKIFDRFFQVESSVTKLYEGTGLGLAISSAYVELLGGKMWLTSVPGKGTTFYFTLPYQKQVQKIQAEAEKPVPHDFIFKKKMKILVAEDVDSNFKLISYFLNGANTELLRAKTGSEAVEKCLADRSIDLVLMDIKMPEMDGYTATKLIREADISIPIIAQTAYAEDKDKAIDSGCSGFIAKPFDKRGLLFKISEFI